MNFTDLLDGYRTLRLRLVTLVGPAAMPEITIAVPQDPGSELGFLRLIGWSYALFHENGKLAVRFLLKLGNHPSPTALQDVQVLRTWMAHNLTPGSESDEKKLLASWDWFRKSCGSTSPTGSQWGECFTALLAAIVAVARDCIKAADLLDDPTDGPRNVDELKRRVDREWEGYRFDRFVDAAAERFGFRGIDPVKLRSLNLDAWRRVVRAASSEDIDGLLTKRIESDVLNLMAGALPLAASAAIESLAAIPPTAVALWLMTLKQRDPMTAEEFARAIEELGNAMIDTQVEPTQPA